MADDTENTNAMAAQAAAMKQRVADALAPDIKVINSPGFTNNIQVHSEEIQNNPQLVPEYVAGHTASNNPEARSPSDSLYISPKYVEDYSAAMKKFKKDGPGWPKEMHEWKEHHHSTDPEYNNGVARALPKSSIHVEPDAPPPSYGPSLAPLTQNAPGGEPHFLVNGREKDRELSAIVAAGGKLTPEQLMQLSTAGQNFNSFAQHPVHVTTGTNVAPAATPATNAASSPSVPTK